MSSAAVKKSETSVKETIESILVAFILAFIFRCFVVEAFVIPTGSMAPTLMGAHMDFRCPDCGYRFSVGYPTSGENFNIGSNAPGEYRLHCPNCGLQIPKDLPSDRDNDATQPPLKFGDRILVMKYLGLFGDNPKRWDVVVFKSPDNTEGDYTVNFIKRLIGRPGESLFVGQGDIYVAPPGADAAIPDSYTVQPKPRWAQDALWRIIFDADYVPQAGGTLRAAGDQWTQPWKQARGAGWVNNLPDKGVSVREFVFDNLTGAGTLAFDPSANPRASGFNDHMGYNQINPFQPPPPTVPAGDLKLDFHVQDLSGDGTLRAVITKHRDTNDPGDSFVAELTPSRVRLLMIREGNETEIGSREMDLTGVHRVSIENADYRAIVRVDGDEVFATTPQQYKPDVAWVIANPRAYPMGSTRIDADRVTAKITHLQLWRDNVYRGADMPGVMRAFASGDLSHRVTLGPKEYFAMGDNSPHSADGRMWSDRTAVNLEAEDLLAPGGIVPERFMLGKAFFVYWPAGFRPPVLPIRAVPNFGDMRFIR